MITMLADQVVTGGCAFNASLALIINGISDIVIPKLQPLSRAPSTLHPTPYTLHPTPHTPHPTPYTLVPTTFHPTP